MAEYAVLYHDPVRLTPELSRSIGAAQSVWVCRNDRYAFEVHVFAERVASDDVDAPDPLAHHGEGRYRLALAIIGGRHAYRVAARDPFPPKADPVMVHCRAADVRAVLESVPPTVAINFGDVIYRFETSEQAKVTQPQPA